MTARPRWFTTERYGNATAAAVAFTVLFFLAVFTVLHSSYLMSNACFDDTNQIVCPSAGPDWARPLPGGAALLGILLGLAGLLAGRPARRAALITGFLVTAAGLTASWLMSP